MDQDPIILSIDTSCDETAAAVTMGRRILSNVISSQVDIHTKYGGVYPALAKRAHQERIDSVVIEALRRASIAYRKINAFSNSKVKTPALPAGKASQLPLSAVAVTQGPGLAIALEVGITKAKEIAGNGLQTTDYRLRHMNNSVQFSAVARSQLAVDGHLPLIAVNHLEGHILSTIAQNSQGNPKREIQFPTLALIVSGGNTQLVLVKSIGQYEIIGETLDDACGEALDKAARILNLGYPGGPIIERLALSGDPKKYLLRPSLIGKYDFNFSYSGLKTAFLYLVNKLPKEEFDHNLSNLAAAFQYWAFEQLTRKLTRAIDVYHPNSIICGGGVIANRYLRNLLHRSASTNNLPIYFPTNKLLYGDNAAMIGIAAYYKYLRSEFIKPEELDRKPRFPL